ncbi:cysteine dioxygenase family protein [Phytohabitans flavus]|uniref:Cysteine dioxygenase n=1 Tax=Phytohabitans flavus TaxID=1076124 RepID=A0A6F8XNQ6_9ACTN|nr:cysteine dioxygenase family protein [Phytohabitans flavus]BCB75464.1 cysteine dioxygenase [Phytohabitans flavus]
MTLFSDLLAAARRWASDPDSWPIQPQYDPVERWYARISETTEHEVWLLTWLPGQETDWHDHGGSAGAFTVVSGALVERTVSGGRVRQTDLPAGAGRRFGAHHVHSVANRGDVPAISIHAYAPALRSMTRYRLVDGKLRVAEVERAGVSW